MGSSLSNTNTYDVSPRLITLEGNIGAGKSHLMETLKKRYKDRTDILFVDEPVDIWEQVGQEGKNMLQLFYNDPKKYSFAFQVLAYNTRLQRLAKVVQKAMLPDEDIRVIIMERSLEADRHIFAKMLYDDGMMEDVMYQIYQKINFVENQYHVDGIVWMTASPSLCLSRIQQRGREGEQKITLEYLEKCDLYHVEWLGNCPEDYLFQIGEDFDIEWKELEKHLGI